MTFHALGLNHLTAPVTLRECFALGEARTRAFLRDVRLTDGAEVVVVSTCNRIEVYLFGSDADAAAVERALSEYAGHAWPAEQAFSFRDEEAVRHVLEVTSGLRSLVLGDAQIFSQVKDAYGLAVKEDRVGTVVHRLMHTAFRTAKRVINETAVGAGGASVAQLAAAAACAGREAADGSTPGARRVLVVGAGQMGQLAVEAAKAYCGTDVSVTNRSPGRARALAESLGVACVAWEDRYAAVGTADAVIVSTSAEAPVLEASLLPHRDPAQPAVLVDISVPRNVDAAADVLPGYRVLDLDALGAEDAALAETQRHAAVTEARAICDEAVGEFVAWVFHHQALQPAIHAILGSFESIRRQEVERHHHRFSSLDRDELDRITQSIIQKLLAIPIVRLKSVEPESIDFAQGIRLLHALFLRPGCEEGAEDEHGCPAFGEGDGAAGTDAAAVTLLREALRSRNTSH